MPIQILQHTPTWVFGVFLLLLALGSRQLLPSRAGLRRLTIVAAAMVGWSGYGAINAFGDTPAAWGMWLVAAATMVTWTLQRPVPAGVRFDRERMAFALPGSAVPLALMMGIFFTKFAVGVQLALHPDLVHRAGFAVAASMIFGAFAGLFLGRTLRLWRLAMQGESIQPMAAPLAK